MYLFIIFFLIFITILFLVYRFFPKLDSFLKNYLPSQRVINIKSEMNNIDKTMKNSQQNSTDQTINEKIIEHINKVVFIPINYLYRGFISFFPSLG